MVWYTIGTEYKNMEEKKTTRAKKSEGGWTTFLFDGIFGSIQSFVDGVLESVHEATHSFTRRLARRVFLFLFAFLGIVFLLFGLAELLSAMYRLPGAGEAIMGIFILLISLVIYTFTKDDR